MSDSRLREAFLQHNGKWPTSLTSGVMYWRGLRITFEEFGEYAAKYGSALIASE